MFAFSSFTQKYPWAFGIIMIIGGPIIALFGQRFFPWVIAGIVSIVILMGAIVSSDVLGFHNTNMSLGISIGVAALISIFVGWLVMKTVWVAVGILGLIGGFFLGSLIYTMFLAAFATGALWAMVTFSTLCAVGGGFLSFRFAKQTVRFFTSLIGSYSFMRGLSYFFGGYPGESIIFKSLME